MKLRLSLGLLFILVLLTVGLLVHSLRQITIYTDQSHALPRIIVFGVCFLLAVLSSPKSLSARISILLMTVLFAELVIYFRPVPIDPTGIGEAVDWFYPFWLSVNLLNVILIPAAVILLVYSYVQGEKPYYTICAAIYLTLVATLFPFKQICRWGT